MRRPLASPLSSWASESKHRRALPRAARLALFAAGALVAVLLLSRRSGTRASAQVSTTLVHDDLVVSEESLRSRVETTRDAFRVPGYEREPASREPRARPAPEAAHDEASPSPSGEDALASRRRRRSQNPEDVRSRAGRSRRRPRPPAEAAAFPDDALIPRIYERAPASHARAAARGAAIRIAAGAVLEARLERALSLGTGSQTVVASVSGAELPPGSRAIGRARLRGERALLTFDRLVLPDGRSARLRAEAEDAGGAGLSGALSVEDPRAPRVARDVARGTGQRLLRGLSHGLIGGAAADAADSYDAAERLRARRSVRSATLHLAAGAKFELLILDPIDIDP